MLLGVDISEGQLGGMVLRAVQEAEQDVDRAMSFTECVEVLEQVDVEQKMSIWFLFFFSSLCLVSSVMDRDQTVPIV